MNEKNNESYVSTEGQKTPNRTNFKSTLKTGAAILGLFTVTSCDTITEKRNNLRGIDPMEQELRQQIKQQKKIIRHEKELEQISYKLAKKIEQRRERVEKYTELLEKCNADPDNLAQKERALQVCQNIGKYNKEIKSLAKKELDITVKLDDKRCEPQSKLPTGAAYTNPYYFDYLVKEELESEDNTANYFDFEEENTGNTGNDGKYEKDSQGCKEETLENLVIN